MPPSTSTNWSIRELYCSLYVEFSRLTPSYECNGDPATRCVLERTVQVEGNDDVSDPEDNEEVVSSSASQLLSPTSKRARKRAIAARNKRLAKEAREVTQGVTTHIQSNVRNDTTALSNDVPSESGGPLIAAFPSQLVSNDGHGNAISAGSESSRRSDAVIVSSAPPPRTSSLPSKESSQINGNLLADEATSTDGDDEEDVSLLVDEDDEESSTASEGEIHQQQVTIPLPTQPQTIPQSPTSEIAGSEATKDSGIARVPADQTTAGFQDDSLKYGTDHDPSKKWRSVATRTIWTLIMIFGFISLVLLGHVYLIILVLACQALVFKEISALFDVAAKPIHHHTHKTELKTRSPTRAAKDAKARAERERYFFAVTNYFLHGETIIYYFKHIVFVDAYFIPFARHHRFISFMLYVLGFVGFVTNLKRNQLRRQFGLFCWIHMSLLLIVVSSHFIVNNILEGIIWFWLPASEVIMNDIAAYVWGMLFGRTQLIKLSPKKTVEGFVGAAFTTVLFGYLWATIFMRFPYMICPATDLGTNAFSRINCSPNDVFIWRSVPLSQDISALLSVLLQTPVTHIPYAPFQLHAVVMAVFASLVAPFGGFFASGFKRAFNVKDFGDSIPGHGGMTDRMDCQFLMGLFAYVYYSSIIRDNHVTVGSVMQTVVSSLSPQEQVELAKALTGYLAQQGVKWK